MSQLIKDEGGATSVEYAVLLALIVGMMVAAITFVGNETNAMSDITVDALDDTLTPNN